MKRPEGMRLKSPRPINRLEGEQYFITPEEEQKLLFDWFSKVSFDEYPELTGIEDDGE